jgi:hypothetical protein
MNQNWLQHQVGYDDEERRDRRRYWWELGKIVFCVACALWLFGWAVKDANAEAPVAGAAMIHVNPDATIRFFDRPCDEPAMKPVIKPDKIGELKAAQGDFRYVSGQRRTFAGCWIYFPEKEGLHPDLYGVIFEDSDTYQIEATKVQVEGT